MSILVAEGDCKKKPKAKLQQISMYALFYQKCQEYTITFISNKLNLSVQQHRVLADAPWSVAGSVLRIYNLLSFFVPQWVHAYRLIKISSGAIWHGSVSNLMFLFTHPTGKMSCTDFCVEKWLLWVSPLPSGLRPGWHWICNVAGKQQEILVRSGVFQCIHWLAIWSAPHPNPTKILRKSKNEQMLLRHMTSVSNCTLSKIQVNLTENTSSSSLTARSWFEMLTELNIHLSLFCLHVNHPALPQCKDK